mgnify:CR=1 FL=1
MARTKERQEALKLRKRGYSYSQIKRELGISKSTLSEWLRGYPLSKERITELRDQNEVRIEKFRQTMKRKRDIRLLVYYEEERAKILPLSNQELLLAGLFLYWGEGNKSSRHIVGVYNTDPSIIKFALHWFTTALDVPRNKIHFRLHLYSDMNVEREVTYWSKVLGLPRSQFNRVYIKKSKRADIDRKGFGHGTAGLMVYNVPMKERISMAIKAIGDYYGKLA